MFIQIDPTENYPEYSPEYVMSRVHVLFQWLCEGLENGETCHDAITSRYPFISSPMTGGDVAEDGEYNYPQDPTLYPLATFENEETGERVFFYEYSMVAFYDVESQETKMYRMD